MTQSELEAALRAAFNQCEAASYPLSDRQKQILLQAVRDTIPLEVVSQIQESDRGRNADASTTESESDTSNPLEQLTPDERQAFFAFVKRQESQNQPWKIALLNDWLEGKSSGAVQFIRERYGIQWVEQITAAHLAHYIDLESSDRPLEVGDRIEVTNGLWEWVQETGPCSREWFSCTVISIQNDSSHRSADTLMQYETVTNGASNDEMSCIVRFEDGAEYEIQGVYDWNRPNWRWLAR